MRFSPKTEDELQADNLWPKGVYDFEVQGATDKKSQAGNDMIELRLKVYDSAGRTQTVWDYLLESFLSKLAHACEALGIYDLYESGELEASDFEGKAGQLVLYVQKAQNGYPAKNAVADYVRPQAAPPRRQASAPTWDAPNPRKPIPAGSGTDLDDEIPF